MKPGSDLATGLSRFVQPGQTEALRNSPSHQWLHLINCQTWNPVGEASHWLPLKTTRGDGGETTQITVHVQGKTMLGDPTATPNPDRRHLAPLEPEPRQAFNPLSTKVQLCQHIDQRLLQLPQIPVQIWGTALQIKHRVHHKLTEAVISHLPTTVDAMQGCGRPSRIEVNMLEAGAAPEGVTGRVLQQPDSLVSTRDIDQALLPALLISPGAIKKHWILRLKKNQLAGVCREPNRS